MMKAMRFSMPSERKLEILFNVDGAGAVRLGDKPKKGPVPQLMKVSVDECECVALLDVCLKACILSPCVYSGLLPVDAYATAVLAVCFSVSSSAA
jgi:hypothetical protein